MTSGSCAVCAFFFLNTKKKTVPMKSFSCALPGYEFSSMRAEKFCPANVFWLMWMVEGNEVEITEIENVSNGLSVN